MDFQETTTGTPLNIFDEDTTPFSAGTPPNTLDSFSAPDFLKDDTIPFSTPNVLEAPVDDPLGFLMSLIPGAAASPATPPVRSPTTTAAEPPRPSSSPREDVLAPIRRVERKDIARCTTVTSETTNTAASPVRLGKRPRDTVSDTTATTAAESPRPSSSPRDVLTPATPIRRVDRKDIARCATPTSDTTTTSSTATTTTTTAATTSTVDAGKDETSSKRQKVDQQRMEVPPPTKPSSLAQRPLSSSQDPSTSSRPGSVPGPSPPVLRSSRPRHIARGATTTTTAAVAQQKTSNSDVVVLEKRNFRRRSMMKTSEIKDVKKTTKKGRNNENEIPKMEKKRQPRERKGRVASKNLP